MNEQTEQHPVLRAGSWNWRNVEEALEEYLLEQLGIDGRLDGTYRNGRDAVRDEDLQKKKTAHLDCESGYIQNAVEFRLDVTYDHLMGDSLEIKELNVIIEQ